MTNKQKFEAGHRFTIPGSNIIYKQVGDHYGNDYIAFLNCGRWKFAMLILQVTDCCLVYLNGESKKKISFESMSFVQ